MPLLAPGQKLDNQKYVIQSVLGAGGRGCAYVATHRKLGHTVVIKTPKDRETIDLRDAYPKYLQEFTTEAELLAQLMTFPHPHIVRILDWFEEPASTFMEQDSHAESLYCMVMEFVDTERGQEHLGRQIPGNGMPEAEAIRYVRQIGAALDHLHRLPKPIVHRDVKPSNIVVRRHDQQAILIDFGLAREFIPNVSKVYTIGLSPNYAPPEQYDQHTRLGAYTDVYALAATLYHLVTGQPAPESLIRETSVLKGRADPLVLPDSLSDRLRAALTQGMVLDPKNRLQTMYEWLQLLADPVPSIASAPIPATPPTPPTLRIGSNATDLISPPPELPKDPLVEGLLGMGRGLKNLVKEVFKEDPSPQVVPQPKQPAENRSPQVVAQLNQPASNRSPQVIQQPKVPQWSVDRVALESEKGANYTKLRDLLRAQKWKEADYETYRLMITIVGRKEGDYFRKEDLLNFPCKDLKTIDRLWRQYSNDRYGFSVQKEIYVRCGAKLDGNYPGDEIWRKFGTEVGWRVNDSWKNYDDLTWNSIHVPGHLPEIYQDTSQSIMHT